MSRFADRTALVTGAASGMGAEIARRLAAEGARVLLADVECAAGEALAAELGQSFARLDVGEEADWAAAVAAAERLGPLTTLVNNAGVYDTALLAETNAALFDRIQRVNVRGTFLGLKLGGEALARAGGGAIVNMSSVAALRSPRGAFAYAASKWAIRGMTKSAALELGEAGVRVNSIHPGLIDTPMVGAIPDDRKAVRVAVTPLGRIGRPRDIAELTLFLLSDEADFITGAEIAIDGGVTL